MLIGTMLLTATGSALAADTRKIYIGPDARALDKSVANADLIGNGTLTFTAVSAGDNALSSIYIRNIDNQSLTHVVVTIAKSQGGSTVTDQVLGQDAGKCDTSGATAIVCDFGNLKAGAARAFSIILVAGSAGSSAISAGIVFNESNNPNGGNQQIESADGTMTIDALSCNSEATFVPPGVAKTLLPDTGSCSTTDGQRSALVVPANANGNVISVNDGATAASCPTGYACFGNQVAGSVNSGAPVSPYLKWTIFYSNSVLGNINPNKVAFDHDGTIILAGNKGLCKNATATNCQEPYVVSAGGVLFIIRTPTNGVIKGMN